MEEGSAIVVHADPGVVGMPQQPFSLVPKSLNEAIEFSKLIASSALCPSEYRGKPADVLLAVQLGLEVAGCSPLQALQNIAVINGRPTMWGDLVLAVVRRSGLLEWIKERDPQECWKTKEGRCTVLRRGEPEPVTRTFTYGMAEQAGLVARSKGVGPWITFPGRMLQVRARALALRDVFGDVLRGLAVREEVEDYEARPSTGAVQMPRRMSEASEVDDFLAGSEGQQKPAATETPRRNPEVSGSQPTEASARPEDTAGHQEWVGVMSQITTKTGTKKNGQPWTLYEVHGEDGEIFGTFDKKLAEEAEKFQMTGEETMIAYSLTPKGSKNIDAISAPAQVE